MVVSYRPDEVVLELCSSRRRVFSGNQEGGARPRWMSSSRANQRSTASGRWEGGDLSVETESDVD